METPGLEPELFLDLERAPDVPEGEAYAAWRLRILSPAEFAGLSMSARLSYLARWNLLAPTSHNTMPQRFRLHPEESTLAIWLDRTFVLGASDVNGRQAAVSVGCGITNTVLAARRYGLETDVQVAPAPPERTRPHVDGEPRYTPLVSLRFQPSPGAPPGDDTWLRAMLARKMVRAEFDERVKLDPALVKQVEGVVAGYPGLEIHLLTDAPTLLFLGKFQELADTTVLNRDSFALELGAWLLDPADPSFLGMRGPEFGMTDEVARHFHEGLLRLQPLQPDEIAGFAKAGNLGMRSSSAVAVITVEEDSVAMRVAAGRAYEELALLLGQHRFCTAMHAGITEVEAPNLALRGRLRTRRRPEVVFRIGRPLLEKDWLRPHAARPPLVRMMVPDGVR